jgi:hypothetical protein
MIFQVEDAHGAFPDGLAVERLFDGLDKHQLGRAAVRPLDCLLELVCRDLN